MIISISGKMGSGKDTVGKIIQLIDAGKGNSEIKGFVENNISYIGLSKWEIKKFADKLKDVACMLIGCTRDDLENQEFKEKELGPEWIQYEGWSVEGTPPLNPNKDYTMTKSSKLYATKEEAKASGSMRHKGYKEVKMTVRELLQKLGTDAMRNGLHENVWVNALMSKYRIVVGYANGNYTNKCNKCGCSFIGDKGAVRCEDCCVYHPNWLITDTRFPNEIEAVKKHKGITIRVTSNREREVSNHASETALNDSKFDYYISNNGTVEELIDKVRETLHIILSENPLD